MPTFLRVYKRFVCAVQCVDMFNNMKEVIRVSGKDKTGLIACGHSTHNLSRLSFTIMKRHIS